MSIAQYIDQLADPEQQVSAGDLAKLSGMTNEEADELRQRWNDIPALRRTEVVGRMVELAEESPEMDFLPVFCYAVEDEEPAVRQLAVTGLWETEDRTAIPKIIQRLEKDAVDEVREAAAVTLGHFAVLADEGKLVKRDVERIWRALLASLEDRDEPLTVRRRSLEAIAGFRTTELRQWIQWAYDHPEPLLRQSAIYAMGQSSDSAWLSLIVDEMESEDPAMRFEAANAAKEMADEQLLPYLHELVNDSDSQVSMAALHAIAGTGGTKARKLLKAYTQGDDPAIREAAGEALQVLESDSEDFSLMKMPAEPDVDELLGIEDLDDER